MGNVPPPPPEAEEEDVEKKAGEAPDDFGDSDDSDSDDDDDGPPPRQSSGSTHPLLDPPRSVPDPYGWMRDDDRTDPEVLDWLRSENAYTEAVTKRLSGLRSKLYDEMVGSLRETDHSCPGKDGPYWYYTRTYEGKSYRAHCRAPVVVAGGGGAAAGATTTTTPVKIEWDGSADSPVLPGEKVYLDENDLAEGKEYCAVGSATESPSHGLLAYTVDYTGDEKYGLHVVDMETGEEVDHDPALECDGSVRWGADDSTLFYVKMDEQHRPYKVYRRRIGLSSRKEGERDKLMYHDPDETTYVSIHKSSDRKYLFVDSSSTETGEVHFLDLTDPNAPLKCVASRRKKVLYEVEHREGSWLITTNVAEDPPSANMKLVIAPAEEECAEKWTLMRDENGSVMFDGGNDRALDDVSAFRGHAVATGREGGVPRVWVISFDDDEAAPNAVKGFRRLDFEEDAYDVGLGPNYEYDASEVVLSYDSTITPPQSLAIPLADCVDPAARRVVKSKIVPGYDKSRFGCERTSVLSRDGKTRIPLTLVYRRDAMERHDVSDGDAVPVHLYGYGAYGYPLEADFGSTRLPLLNRGVVYALAHVRGGGEMGRQWYEEPDGAKYLCKRNTFNDFVDVARWLINDRKLTTARRLSCEGRSAGGLLVGASVNQDPSLFRVAVLGVPFVDVVSTMIDASIPLTAGEWEEWGNPNEGHYFEYMLNYSPVNNVRKGGTYPSILITGGLHDPRVQYWEPTKFAAALRHGMDTDRSGPVCVKMEMTAGHFSASDRYKYLRELAFDYAFLLDQMGLVGEEEYDDDNGAAEEKGKEEEERQDAEQN